MPCFIWIRRGIFERNSAIFKMDWIICIFTILFDQKILDKQIEIRYYKRVAPDAFTIQ